MNTPDANTPSEMLHLFLDGELDSFHETTLFNNLSADEDLRSEMRDMLSIRGSIQNDTQAFTPPLSATNNVFSRLGFAVPPQALNLLMPNAAASGSSIFSNILSRIWAPALAATVGALITALILSNIYDNRFAELKNSIPKIVSAETSNLLKQSEHSGDLRNSPRNLTASNIDAGKVRTITKIVYLPSKTDNSTGNSNSVMSSPYEEKNNLIAFSDLKPENNSRNDFLSLQNRNIVSSPVSEGFYKPLIYSSKSIDNRYSLQLRGIQGKSFPETGLPVPSQPFFTNMSLGAYYRLSDNIKIGMEAGEEPFGQIFNNKEGNLQYEYVQNPMLFWAGIGIKGIMDYSIKFLGGAHPYAEVLLGGTELGPTGKTLIGLQYISSETGIGIIIGAEGTLLMYQNQSSWYNTKKIGFTYGMTFHF